LASIKGEPKPPAPAAYAKAGPAFGCHQSIKDSRYVEISGIKRYPISADLSPPAMRPSSAESTFDEARLMAKSSLAVVGHVGPAPTGDRISAPHALAALAALGQPTRLEIFRQLIRREPGGLAAGAIAHAINCPHNTLSTHLSILARSGLVRGTRSGRSIIYRADVDGMRALITFLIKDCCDGHPDVCNFFALLRNPDCSPPVSKRKQRRK
jgi:ArsR family transcriptional regulator, arsenate/arsenite/antimonite-responsive transcriptional repressor